MLLASFLTGERSGLSNQRKNSLEHCLARTPPPCSKAGSIHGHQGTLLPCVYAGGWILSKYFNTALLLRCVHKGLAPIKKGMELLAHKSQPSSTCALLSELLNRLKAMGASPGFLLVLYGKWQEDSLSSHQKRKQDIQTIHCAQLENKINLPSCKCCSSASHMFRGVHLGFWRHSQAAFPAWPENKLRGSCLLQRHTLQDCWDRSTDSCNKFYSRFHSARNFM